MDWFEKARRLLEDRKLRPVDVSRAGGLRGNTLAALLSGRNIPQSDKGVRIARGFGVSAEWLFDDEQGYPPPRSTLLGEGDLSPEVEAQLEPLVERILAKKLRSLGESVVTGERKDEIDHAS